MTTQSKDEQLRRDLEIEAHASIAEAFERGTAQGRKEMALQVVQLFARATGSAPGTLEASIALAEVSMAITSLCWRELGFDVAPPDAPASKGGA